MRRERFAQYRLIKHEQAAGRSKGSATRQALRLGDSCDRRQGWGEGAPWAGLGRGLS